MIYLGPSLKAWVRRRTSQRHRNPNSSKCALLLNPCSSITTTTSR